MRRTNENAPTRRPSEKRPTSRVGCKVPNMAQRGGKDAGRLFWRDNQPFNFNAADMKELNDELKKCGEADTAAKNETKLAG